MNKAAEVSASGSIFHMHTSYQSFGFFPPKQNLRRVGGTCSLRLQEQVVRYVIFSPVVICHLTSKLSSRTLSVQLNYGAETRLIVGRPSRSPHLNEAPSGKAD